MTDVRSLLKRLYTGDDAGARRFRYGLLVFDIVALIYFVVASFFRLEPWIVALDLMLAAPIAADIVARYLITERKGVYFLRLTTWLDVIVLASLIAPFALENLLFLRVLRAVRLLRSYHVLADLKATSRFVARNEELIESVINLTVFVFVMTALVFALQVRVNPGITNYVDALYFTITALTTTGFGDITLLGSGGKTLAIVLMVFGVALFLRLVQTIFRPRKVQYECPDCGLNRHDADSVHCKHCGRVLHIVDEGL